MKKLLFIGLLLISTFGAASQTLIATSVNPDATANHNQRKIVRDPGGNKYVVFTDTMDQISVIKRVKYTALAGSWDNATFLFVGKSPTLAINEAGKISLVFQSNDSLSKIMYSSTMDFVSWTPPVQISDSNTINTLPVADVDSSGLLNVFWITQHDSLLHTMTYACIADDTLLNRIAVVSKNEITDVAVANHLQYGDDVLLFAYQYNGDSLMLLKSHDHLTTLDTVYEAIGSQPCISYNYFFDMAPDEDYTRFLFLDSLANLIETEFEDTWSTFTSVMILPGTIDYLCIDNLAPPIGYSFLFMKDEILYHGFSYGHLYWSGYDILDTISTGPINPSIAYKSFDIEFVDFLWMEMEGSHYNIYFKRDSKETSLGTVDSESGKGFTITGFPNPFTETLTIRISGEDMKDQPEIKIYDVHSRLVNMLMPASSLQDGFEYQWSGLNMDGDRVAPGVFIITATVAYRMTARKVVYIR
ncbi:MAG: hypothetical protein FJY10_06570 [Bacteroidetes bacterium]|nr:hypothetical protein [Bacteroidota bacterium]